MNTERTDRFNSSIGRCSALAFPSAASLRFVDKNWARFRVTAKSYYQDFCSIAWEAALEAFESRNSDRVISRIGPPYGDLAMRVVGLDEGFIRRPLREFIPSIHSKAVDWRYGDCHVRTLHDAHGIQLSCQRPPDDWGKNPLFDAMMLAISTAIWTPNSGGELKYVAGNGTIRRVTVGFALGRTDVSKLPLRSNDVSMPVRELSHRETA